MNKEFTLDLNDKEAEYLNTLIPKNNSFQIFQKAQRRRKAEKKLDDMYVAQFSLRPSKKVKKENQVNQSKKQPHSFQNNEIQKHTALSNPNQVIKNTQIANECQKEKIKQKDLKQQPMKKQKKEMEVSKMPQIVQSHTSRSQRVSKPTSAYLQFQQDTFRRKFVERIDKKLIPQIPLNNQELLQNKKIQKIEKEQRIEDMKGDFQKRMNLSKQGNQQNEKKSYVTKNEMRKQVGIQNKDTLQQKCRDSIISGKTQKFNEHKFKNKPIQNEVVAQALLKDNTVKDNKCLEKLVILNSEKQMQTKLRLNDHQPVNNSKKSDQDNRNKNAKNLRKPLQQPLLIKKCQHVLQRLKTHKASWPFRHPVDPEAQGVPDYFEKIKNPMDLKTIEKKLRASKYKTQSDFNGDVTLMLQNSFQFNPPASKYYNLTSELSEYFNELKSKPYLPKFTGRNSPKDDNYQSDYGNEENEGQKDQRAEQKIGKQGKKDEQKNLKEEQWKRSNSHMQSIQRDQVANHKIAKVFITNEGATRKDNKRSQGKKQTQKPNQNSSKFNQVKSKKSNQANRQLQAIQIEHRKQENSSKKQSQPIKSQAINLSCSGADVNVEKIATQRPEIKKQQEQRFGYPKDKVTAIQRETLLYDILHINSPEVRNQIEEFLYKNREIFKKFKCFQDKKSLTGKQNSNRQQNVQNEENMSDDDSVESYDLELRDLDLASYKVLREEVDRLSRLDSRENQQKKETFRREIVENQVVNKQLR